MKTIYYLKKQSGEIITSGNLKKCETMRKKLAGLTNEFNYITTKKEKENEKK